MLCFGKGNGIYFDKSTSQCIKNLLSLDYGSVDIVNLFSSSDMHMNGSKETIDCVALFFIVLGEVLFFGTLTYINRLTAISKISVTSIAGVYMFINIVFSALLKGAFKDNILTFSILHIIFICLAAVAILLLSGVLKSINKDKKNIIQQKSVIDECERIANILSHSSKFENHSHILNQIYDEIKYNDHVSDYKSGEILTALNEIYNCTDNDNIDTLCRKAHALVQERNITVKQLKRGGF